MIQTSTRRRLGAGTAVGALVAAGLLITPTAQAAAAQVTVRNSELQTSETSTNYATWHQGYANATTRAKITTAGLELSGGPSQVIKGYANNSSTIDTKNFDLAEKITGARFTATSGVANLQVPIFADNVVPTGSGTSKFATLRSAIDTGSQIKLTDEWVSSKQIGSIPANTPTPLKELIPALGNYKVIAFGVQADNNAVVSTITWDGTTYVFQEPVPPVVKASSVVDIYRVQPASGKITTKKTVKVYATVTIGGKAAPAGTVVTGYAKGKKVSTGKVNSRGKVKLTLRKLPKGRSTLKVQLAGSATVVGSTDSVTVKVVKK